MPKCHECDIIRASLHRQWRNAVDYKNIITIDPSKRSGQPIIRNTRMTVIDVLEYLAGGMTPEEIVAEWPNLTIEDIRACLAFAADRERFFAANSVVGKWPAEPSYPLRGKPVFLIDPFEPATLTEEWSVLS